MAKLDRNLPDGKPSSADLGLMMDIVVSYILLGGLAFAFTLLIAGLVWHWAQTGHLQFDYQLGRRNLLQFLKWNVSQIYQGAISPRRLISFGIAVLMLTPYARVIASVLYFAIVERNWKYSLFTGFVLAFLTYSLMLQ